MESKLIRYLDGVLEAIWLVTIITIPLFFNVYSNRIFEPDKIALLRIFSSTALAVWVVKIVAYGSVTNIPRKGLGAYISSILRIPIIIPILVFLFASIIATIFSIAPRTSLWGSYQRLQGLYTTISYVILFFVLVANLNSRKQIDRIITVIAMTSLPVALYGIIQKYGLDPVPWEGDVTVRIASSMGNSIFVAGFLIMAFPATIIRIYENFRALMKIEEGVLKYIIRASVYVTVACTQVIAIFLSGSRGPMIGLLVSILFISILLLVRVKNKAILVSFLIVGLLLGGFLILLNIEKGPLESVRKSPLIGRFGKLLDPESNSALVRKYIWQGAVELISPHKPLVFPDGTEDRLNSLRPIIGYGPETMFVAFNRFYNPELGSVEKRNASPDRAHNESWDMVVTTGILGLIAYLLLFSLIFYYSLKWLSLINTRKEQYIFFSLYLGSGIASGLIVSLWRESAYLGIGLPVGFVIGLFLYLIYVGLVTSSKGDRSSINWIAYIILASLFSAIIAHFIEINFGISIAATRTYFWIYVGLILIIGYKFKENKEFWNEIVDYSKSQNTDNHPGLVNYKQENRRLSGNFRSTKVENKPLDFSITKMWIYDVLIYSLLLSVTLCILGYDLLSNQGEHSSSIKILWASLTEIDRGNSIGILLLLVTTWLLTGVVYSLEITVVNINEKIRRNTRISAVAFVLTVSAIISSIFVLWHTSGLSNLVFEQINSIDQLFRQVSRYEFLITRVLIYLLVIIFSLGYVLAIKPVLNKKSKKNNSMIGFVTAVILIPVFLAVALYLNLRIIQADIVYRLGNAFSQPGQWSVAVEVYKRSIELMPGEDHYYLSLASAYFEQAKALNDVQERERLVKQAESDLIKAQMINPLNTDHTANLARLYNLWSSFTENPELKETRLLKSSEYYQLALSLSPNNTRLWNELALLNLYGFRDSSEALRLLDYSLRIDPEYDWTHGLLGDYYVQQADLIEDEEQKRQLLEMANREYSQALANVKYYEAQYRFSYLRALGAVYVKLGKLEDAILAYEKAINVKSAYDIWRIEDSLARLYLEIGEPEKAINYAQSAYDKAPESYRDRLLQLINFINSNRQ